MITSYWYIGDKGKFEDTRGARLGASDIASLIPDSERPTESLAGYDQTAITLYEKKISKPTNYVQSLAAECGHEHENKSLELFVRQFFGYELGLELKIKKQEYENKLQWAKINKLEKPSPEEYQAGLFRHNTEYYQDGMIVHPDLIYLGDPELLNAPKDERYKTVNGVRVDFAKPFYIEAKSARKEATNRRDGVFNKGYDFKLFNWQGIPLKHFAQMQFQSALYQVDTGYLTLLHNTSEHQVWRVDKDKKWQKRIINIVGKMIKHIELKIMPLEMSICLADIIANYKNLKGDFLTLSGEKAEKVRAICLEEKKAKDQIKKWKNTAKDCSDSLSVYLKDFDYIMDGSDILVKWKMTKARISIGLDKSITGKLSFLDYLELNDKAGYRYLEKRGYLKTGKASRSIDVKLKP